jgi:hypothetical protein
MPLYRVTPDIKDFELLVEAVDEDEAALLAQNNLVARSLDTEQMRIDLFEVGHLTITEANDGDENDWENAELTSKVNYGSVLSRKWAKQLLQFMWERNDFGILGGALPQDIVTPMMITISLVIHKLDEGATKAELLAYADERREVIQQKPKLLREALEALWLTIREIIDDLED